MSQKESKTPAVGKQPSAPATELGGGNVRGEVAGCPTGLADHEQAQAAQQPGGGGAPGTGEPEEAPVSSQPLSPGEGVTEGQMQRSGVKP
jgi:hypothetical protein